MTKHTPARRKRSRQSSTKTEDQSSKPCAVVGDPQTPPNTRRVKLKPHQDVKFMFSASFNIKTHANTILNTPLLLSPTGTASTASFSGIDDDAGWDSPTPSHLLNSQISSDLVFTPCTPMTPVHGGITLQKEVHPVATENPGVCENNCSRQAGSCIKDLQKDDYFSKPKLIRNWTDKLLASKSRNLVIYSEAYLTIHRQLRIATVSQIKRLTVSNPK